MTLRLRYHTAARDELREALRFSEEERPGRGLALQAAVQRVEARLRTLPGSAPRWPEVEGSMIFRKARIPRFPYLLVYTELAGELVVVAFAHTSRRPDYWRLRPTENDE